MASESVFEKKLTAETKMDKVEGLLEHFNLPPKTIDFIRINQRLIQIAIVLLVVAVVFWSLYGSYRDQRRAEASSALALALQNTEDEKAEALRSVVAEYDGTSSALWASVEIAHLDMKNGRFAEASKKYQDILKEVKSSNPIYPLLLSSLAQSLEAEKDFQGAFSKYDILKDIKGFEQIAYIGMGRLEEAQGNMDKAIAIYNNFLLSMADDPSYPQIQASINAMIARLRIKK